MNEEEECQAASPAEEELPQEDERIKPESVQLIVAPVGAGGKGKDIDEYYEEPKKEGGSERLSEEAESTAVTTTVKSTLSSDEAAGDSSPGEEAEESPATAAPSTSRGKRPRRKSVKSSAPKKSRIPLGPPMTEAWLTTVDAFHEVALWEGSSKIWAKVKSKTIEKGEAWMKEPVSLPTRYFVELLSLMYSKLPVANPPWKLLPSSLICVAAGTERQLHLRRCEQPLPIALPITINIRNENQHHYFVPLLVAAWSTLKVVENQLEALKIIPPLLIAGSLDCVIHCPTLYTQLALLGYEAPSPAALLEEMCPQSWDGLNELIKDHRAPESSRLARRKVARTQSSADSVIQLSDSKKVNDFQTAINNCFDELKKKQEQMRDAYNGKSNETPVAEKDYLQGDVIFRNVPCSLLLTYSAALRTDIYRYLDISPAMLEYMFDDELTPEDDSAQSDLDKAFIDKTESLKIHEWRDMKKEHFRVLDSGLQVFLDFTLTGKQSAALMGPKLVPEEFEARSAAVKLLSLAPKVGDSAAPSRPPNAQIDLTFESLLKLASNPAPEKGSPGKAAQTVVQLIDLGNQEKLVNIVATSDIKRGDPLVVDLGVKWKLVDHDYFLDE